MIEDELRSEIALLQASWQQVYGGQLRLVEAEAKPYGVSALILHHAPTAWVVAEPAPDDSVTAQTTLDSWAQLLAALLKERQNAGRLSDELALTQNRLHFHQAIAERIQTAANPWQLAVETVRLAVSEIGAENGFVAQLQDGNFRYLSAAPMDSAVVETLVRRMDVAPVTLVYCPQDNGCGDTLMTIDGVHSLLMKKMPLNSGSTIFAALLNRMDAPNFGPADLDLFRIVSDQVRLAIDVIALSGQRTASELVQRDLEMAERVQTAFLPAQLPAIPGYDVAARLVPAARMSGDFYDVYVSPERVGLLVCDVSGKGISGALLASNVRVVARVQLSQNIAPGEAMQSANEVLFDDMSRTDHFATAVLIATQPGGSRWSYANAGHTTALLIRAATLEIIRLPSLTMPLGIERQIPAVTEDFMMEPEDVLILYSDGLSEATGSRLRLIGMSGILHVALASRNGPAELMVTSMVKLIDHYRGTQPLEDDVTVMVVKRDAPTQARLHWRFSWELAADLSVAWQVERDLERLRPFLAETEVANTWLLEVELALTELFNNIVQYAYAGTENEVIHGLIVLSEDWLAIDMVDRGVLYVPRPEPAKFDPLEPSVGGYGMRIIRQVFDTVDIRAADGTFNCWHLERRLPEDVLLQP